MLPGGPPPPWPTAPEYGQSQSDKDPREFWRATNTPGETKDRALQPGLAAQLLGTPRTHRPQLYFRISGAIFWQARKARTRRDRPSVCVQSPVFPQVRFWREVGRQFSAQSRSELRIDHSNRGRIALPRRECQCACRLTARSCVAVSRSCGRCPPEREIRADHYRSLAHFVCYDIPSHWSG